MYRRWNPGMMTVFSQILLFGLELQYKKIIQVH